MSKADEMFEELGYIKNIVNDRITQTMIIYEKIEGKFIKRINFYKDIKVECTLNILHCFKLNIEELQAVYEKCKELGWIK